MPSSLKKSAAKVVQMLTAWSYSRFVDYDQCPLKCKLKHIEKRREPDNEHTTRGTLTHKLAEQFVSGQLVKYPVKELGKGFKDRFVALKKLGTVSCEQEWAFDKLWKPVSWFAPAAWVRIKMDAHHLTAEKLKGKVTNTQVSAIDYKTGREHAEHSQQRSLYALGAFHMYPDAATVHVEHWYLDAGTKGEDDFSVKDVPALLKQWEQRTRAMLADKRFAPRPSDKCRWCHFRKSNAGPCQY